jgi:hypothetical protein
MNGSPTIRVGIWLRDGLSLVALAAAVGLVFVWEQRQDPDQVVFSVMDRGEPEAGVSSGDLITPATVLRNEQDEAFPAAVASSDASARSAYSPVPMEEAGEVPLDLETRLVPSNPAAPLLPLVEGKQEPTAPPEPEPQRPEVLFFRTAAEANSVAYVVDCSGSMASRRFERARAELNQSVGRLQSGQRFHVSFFNDRPIPMFGDHQPSELSPASPAVKARVQSWMEQVRGSGGTMPDQALQIAAKLRPEVIYLLSDGEFSPLRTATRDLIQARGIVVHTIAFESSSGGRMLEEIASWSGGTYRFVPGDASSTLKLDFAIRLSAANRTRLQRIVAGAPDGWELAHGSGQPAPSLMEELFELLRDSDPSLRRDVRHALSFLTGSVEFDLPDCADAAQRDAAVQRWQQWFLAETRRGFRNRLMATSQRERPLRVKNMVESPNVQERWAAACYINSRSLRMPNHLLTLIGDPDRDIRAEARRGLVAMADGCDFGPPDDATDEQLVAARADWHSWWEESKLRERMRLAEVMAETNPEAAARRLEKLIREHPDSVTARKARTMLAGIDKIAAAAPVAKKTADPPTEDDERLAEAMLRYAVQFLGRSPDALHERLREVIQRYPGTRAALAAEEHLEKVGR